MSQTDKKFKTPVDGVIILILFFLISLFILFLYSKNIGQNLKKYDDYKISIVKLHSFNQDIDNTLMRSYLYLDNDQVTEITKNFDRELIFLEKHELTKVFRTDVIETLEKINAKYQKKSEFIESFKTLNARITSSMSYLYELEKSIANKNHLKVEIKKLPREILFKIGQIFLGTDLEILQIQKDMDKLFVHRAVDDELDYFYMHTKQFLSDYRLLNKVLKQNGELDLDSTIHSMLSLLEKEYQHNKKTEESIAVGFFIFALIILIMLLNTYLKVLKNREEVSYLAYHDTLTNLPNRAEFERYIDQLTNGNPQPSKQFAVLFIDLDRFKVINDTLGHDVGDGMLIVLAERIGKILGRENMLARIGGDEFVAIVENKRDVETMEILAAEIASVIRNPIRIREYSLNTTASIGIARFPDDGDLKSTLLKHADSAMYHAKEIGGDTYAFYNEKLSIDIQRRLELEQELVNALQKGEFTLYYQPQYHISAKKIIGAEALVRWDSAKLGKVSAEEFINVAEDTGVIVDIGYFIFRSACQEYMNWKQQGIDLNSIAINISSVQLRQPGAYRIFKEIIQETGIEAKHIEIELTERYVMEYATQELSILDDLRLLGCRVSIDDFGTGYSSMSYLKSLDVDSIKIDKSFTSGLPDNQHDIEVTKAIIALSKSLGYEVIAEGIERVEQLNLLKELDCDIGQGYYFAQPLKSEEFVDFLKMKEDYILV